MKRCLLPFILLLAMVLISGCESDSGDSGDAASTSSSSSSGGGQSSTVQTSDTTLNISAPPVNITTTTHTEQSVGGLSRDSQ